MSNKKTIFPQEFIDKYAKLLGSEWDKFLETIKQKQPKSAWVNANKLGASVVYEKLHEISRLEKPSSCDSKNSQTVNGNAKAFGLSEKDIGFKKYSFSNQAFEIEMEKPGDLEFFKHGKISLQEKAAMLPVIALAPTKDDYVLDACAAPGMKTIQLSNLAGKVLAIDVNSERIKSLVHNKGKYALQNVQVKRTDVRNVNEQFDKIVLDAPCSSEGLVRKKRNALQGWNMGVVTRKAKLQKELITHCFDLLKTGGEMVYATCSFAPEENEEVILHLLKERNNAKIVPMHLEGIKIRENKLCKYCVRLYPQDNNTQQFFLAKIKKK